MVARIVKAKNFKVRKKDGEVTNFVPKKILTSLKKAAKHAGVSDLEVKALYSRIIHEKNLFKSYIK